jgi:hypothetical protein
VGTSGYRQILAAIGLFLLAGGCAIQRAVVASEAKDHMVGFSKEQILACMGPPASKATEGATEVWSYGSGDGTTISSAQATGGTMFGRPTVNAIGMSQQRFCTVNVIMTGGRVSRVNYSGPTGGLLTAGEQCAYAVANCAK